VPAAIYRVIVAVLLLIDFDAEIAPIVPVGIALTVPPLNTCPLVGVIVYALVLGVTVNVSSGLKV